MFSSFDYNMNILPINNYTPTRKISSCNTNFNANERWIYDAYKTPLYKTTTYMLRNDLNWEDYIKMLCTKFHSTDKVNVLIHACSNGMEAISFLIALMDKKPKYLDKFCPIIAKDIDSYNIQQANNGIFEVSKGDIYRIQEFTGNNLNRYFKSRIRGDKIYLEPIKEISNRIIFETGDLSKDIHTMPKYNSILQARNLWRYLPYYQAKSMLQNISEKMSDETSILTLGDFDHSQEIDNILRNFNFLENLNVNNVYTKNTNSIGKHCSFLY